MSRLEESPHSALACGNWGLHLEVRGMVAHQACMLLRVLFVVHLVHLTQARLGSGRQAHRGGNPGHS